MTPTRFLLVLLLSIASILPASAAPATRAADPASKPLTAAQGDAILAELKAIRDMLEEDRKSGDAPAGKVRLADQALYSLGSPTAPVTIVEFTDYQCPYCRRFHAQSWPDLKKAYVDTGKVRFIVRDLPLDFHEQALPAALAARCAGEQGKYWPMYEALLGQTEAMTKDTARRAALTAGVEVSTFDACLHNPGIRKSIENDIAEAERIGITGTPGFVIAQRQNGQLEGTLLLGAQPTSAFSTRIEALLGAH